MPAKSSPTRFLLRCDPDGRYFYSVEVHPNQKAMLRAMHKLGAPKKHSLDSRAACLRYELKKPHPAHEQIGTIFFNREDAGVEVVMHELAHAAVGWARKVGIQPVDAPKRVRYRDDPEERFVTCLQYMVRQFYAPRS